MALDNPHYVTLSDATITLPKLPMLYMLQLPEVGHSLKLPLCQDIHVGTCDM